MKHSTKVYVLEGSKESQKTSISGTNVRLSVYFCFSRFGKSCFSAPLHVVTYRHE